MALLQVQALLVSLLAGLVAFVLGTMSRHGLTDSPAALTGHKSIIANSTLTSTVGIGAVAEQAGNLIPGLGIERGGYFEAVMVLSASMLAASLSSAVVGAFMCSLVVMSRFLRINPGMSG